MRFSTDFVCAVRAMLLPAFFGVLVLVCTAGFASGQSSDNTVSAIVTPTKTSISPALHDLRGITLGMSTSEVKKKLGSPNASDESSMYYDRDNVTVQLRLKDGKTEMVAVTYSGKDAAQMPDAAAVFGPGVDVEPDESGKIYRMVRYPDAGYWVAYSRITLKEKTMTTVTLQSLR